MHRLRIESCMATARPRRAGWTLIELLLAMTVGATIFAVAVELFALAMRADSTGHDRAGAATAIDRIAEQFRADAHVAESVTAPAAKEGAVGCTLRLPDEGRVEYEFTTQDHLLRRTEYRGATLQRRDAYQLSDDSTVHWELRAVSERTIASLIVEFPADSQPESQKTILRIDANVGFDRRSARATAGK